MGEYRHGGWLTKLDRITVDPARMNGRPAIRNMRLTVRRVIELLALYLDRDELRREYPELQAIAVAQRQLGETQFAAAWLRGQAMTSEEIEATEGEVWIWNGRVVLFHFASPRLPETFSKMTTFQNFLNEI